MDSSTQDCACRISTRPAHHPSARGSQNLRFGNFTFREIRECAEKGWLAVVPTDCTEQQGPHLPVDFDTSFVETVCLAAARRATEEHGVQ